jgi:predicted phage-related endonuclease
VIISNCVQGTEEWFKEKAGVPSSSNFDKIITTKGEPSKSREAYMYRLAGERITGMTVETYQSKAMKDGIEKEAEARSLFEMIKDKDVAQVGMIYPDEEKKCLCSPDGLICDSEGLEIKCPELHTHVSYLLKGELPATYFQQVQGSLYVTNFNVWWFMSYFPGLPPLILKIKRDEDFILKLHLGLEKFCVELDQVTEKIRNIK